MKLIATLLVITALSGFAYIESTRLHPEQDGIRYDRQIFYAVLEGLYHDGVSNETVDRVLMKGKDNGYIHFIRGCPLCVPALEAFRHYRQRPDFVSYKMTRNTWGPGLTEDLRKRLGADELETRLDVVNTLVKRFIKRRLDSLRLTDDELSRWRQHMESGRKKGMAILRSTKQGGGMTEWGEISDCAVCDASNEACEKTR